MSLRYLLDTNVMIDLIRDSGRLDAQRFIAAEGVLAVSTVTVMELEYGIECSSKPRHNRAQVEELLSLVQVLLFDQAAAEHAGRIRAVLGAAGTPIGPYDSLLAGHARSLGLTLVTHNTTEFDRVPGLLVENWTVCK